MTCSDDRLALTQTGNRTPVSFYDYDSGETFNLSNNLDRCLGKGGYYYIASSANGSTDDKNTIHRIAYFNGKGKSTISTPLLSRPM